MFETLDRIDRRLLDEFQRDLPVVTRPFGVIAERLGTTEADVIERLRRHLDAGHIARVGAAVRPNTIGASTLAAMAVPAERLDEVAALLSSEACINHSYLREDDWNLWFVVTAADEPALEAALARIHHNTGLRVLDLRLRRAFHIDLGFNLASDTEKPAHRARPDLAVLRESDRPLLQALSDGLAIVPNPYKALAEELGLRVEPVMQRIGMLCGAGIISRLGVIVRHRPLGWAANAMAVWDLPEENVAAAGTALARLPGVSLCYQRRTEPDVWPYSLYIMAHGRTRQETSAIVQAAAALPKLRGCNHKVLFSSHCYKQTGAWFHRRELAA